MDKMYAELADDGVARKVKSAARKAVIAELKAAEDHARAEMARLDAMSDEDFDENAETGRLFGDFENDRVLLRKTRALFCPARRASSGATVIQFSGRRREGRVREHRSRSGRSSARSGDSGSDDGESEPPSNWHWSQPYGWQGYIRSIEPGTFEQQRQRAGGAR